MQSHRSTAEADRLFVYGTLQPGEPNEHVLDGIHGVWQRASIRGHLHDLGWGSGMGYPALVLDPEGPEISGFVLTSEDLPLHWSRLDDFEGDEYRRVAAEVLLADSKRVVAYLYVLR